MGERNTGAAGPRQKGLERVHWARSLAVTAILIALMAAASFLVTSWIGEEEEELGFSQLYHEAASLASSIEKNAKSDHEQLELLAGVVARFEDPASPELWALLDSYQAVGMMSRLEMLLPDDTVLTAGGKAVDASGVLSFAQEAAHGAHITDRQRDLGEDDEYILRHYMPVVQNGETVAMLYGVVELGSLPQELLSRPYGGQASIYLIDGATGDFLVDTWHQDDLGNIWDLGQRPMAPGYDHEQLKQGLTDGESGYVVFVSQSIGKYLYFYYQPMAINQWRIALSVPEDVVFASGNAVRQALNLFLVFEAVCFLLYFLWMFRYVRRETSEKQRRLDTIQYIYDVENLLFNAHEEQGNVMTALEKIAHITSARQLAFWLVGGPGERQAFLWREDRAPAGEQWDLADRLLDYFRQGHTLFSAPEENAPEAAGLWTPGAGEKRLSAIPIPDASGGICGILAAWDAPQADPSLLKSVAFSFSMFCHNIRTFRAIRVLGEKDTLSGLYNRNRYELDLPEMPGKLHTSLACVYLDANGLHELNNSQGHEAGDTMLRAIGQVLRRKFGSQYTYRIGGDEFLAFAVDLDEDAVLRLVQETQEELARQQVQVSIGLQWQREVPSIQDLVRRAEEKMYSAKSLYYQDQGRTDYRRERRPSLDDGGASGQQ